MVRIERVLLFDKKKDKNVLEDFLKRNFYWEGKLDIDVVKKCDVVLELFFLYFSFRDVFLDYVLLYLLLIENDD